MNREPTFSNDTMSLKGPVCDGVTFEIYCSPHCAEQGYAHEDALMEVDPEPGDSCAFCGKPLRLIEDIPLFDETAEPIEPPPPKKEYDGPPLYGRD